MLSKKEISQVRKHLEKSQNPIFLYDNDVDGLCSYVLLRKYINRGKGVAVKSHPDIDELYAKKVQQLNGDYIFVLDRHELGIKFIDEVKNLQIPIVWIDHHNADLPDYNYQNLYIFNPNKSKEKSKEPVTYLSHIISNKKENTWIALIGCIADHYLPSFTTQIKKEFPEYFKNKIVQPFDIYYNTDFGKLIKGLSFGIKDSITHVIQLQNFLINCKSPKELEIELESSRPLGKKYKEINKKYSSLLEKAKKINDENLIFFNYGGDLSISSDLSNELSYFNQDKIISVAYTAGPITNISLRGKNAKKLFEKIKPLLGNVTGGGHDEAVGMRIETDHLETFKNELSKLLK